MSQKKDDVFELNFDDFNTGLLEKNLEEKGTNEFLNYYIEDHEKKNKNSIDVSCTLLSDRSIIE